MTRSISAETIEQRLNKGVLNVWYPVLPSWGVHNTPVGIHPLRAKTWCYGAIMTAKFTR